MYTGGIRPQLIALSLCLLFLVTGCLWISLPGIQNDEALFAAGIYEPIAIHHHIRIFKRDYPLMVMTYVGALKSLVYQPIFAVWAPSAASTRVPMLLVGALSVWLFYRFLLRAQGVKTALIGTALLATDTTYLWTIRCDWGPVAFQHLFLIAGLLAFVQRRIGWGFFFFGLGMWDKAIFIWCMTGVAVATLAVYPRQLWQEFTLRRAAIGVLAFAAGAFPLIRYNIKENFVTFRSNVRWSAEGLPGKLEIVRITMNGHGFGGWAARAPDAYSRGARDLAEQVSLKLSDLNGQRDHHWMYAAFLLSFAGLFTLARRAMLWGLVFLVVTFLQMALNPDTGGSIHHAILLWPVPVFMIALAIAELPRRAALAATLLLCVTNLLATNETYARFIRHDGIKTWSSAIYHLTKELQNVPAASVAGIDWGYTFGLRLLGAGKFPIQGVTDPVADDEITAEDRRIARHFFRDPQNVFVTYTDENQAFANVNVRLRRIAETEGYERTDIRVIKDDHGRPIYEVFRFAPKAGGPNNSGTWKH